MASRQRKKEQRWPLGTKIRKFFPDHGDFDGEVKDFQDGLYSIEYTDGDKEQFDEREMKRYLLKTPSFTSTNPPPSKAAASSRKQASAKKKPPPNNETEKDSDGDEDYKESATSNDDDESPESDASTPKAAAPAAAKKKSDERINQEMMRGIEEMHQEMEVTGFIRGKGGQKRRKVN